MLKTAPCYSKKDYYEFYAIDFTDKKVLDIGSSIGSFQKSSRFKDSSKSIGSAKKYLTMDINPDSGADIVGDAHNLPFKENEFDIIIANNVIEHFYNPAKATSEMKRVLKKGGLVYYTIPFLYPIHEAPHDYVRFTRFGIEKIFENFNITTTYSRGGFFSTTALYIYKMTHVLDSVKLGVLFRAIITPILWLWVQLDRLDTSEAFVRVYFGKAVK